MEIAATKYIKKFKKSNEENIIDLKFKQNHSNFLRLVSDTIQIMFYRPLEEVTLCDYDQIY